MTTYLWPDVSNVNGRAIDAAAAKAAGMHAITAKASEGLFFRDALLGANYRSAKAAGLPFMAYHYPHSGNGAGQADFFVSYVEEQCGTLAGIALMIDREAADGPTTDAFILRLKELAPHNAISGYEAAWVVEQFGPSVEMTKIPLIWSNYVQGPDVSLVTPGWFEPFGGHGGYAARQFSDAGNIGGIHPCDLNVCFDDAAWNELFGLVPVAHPVPPVVAPRAPFIPTTSKGGQSVVTAVNFSNEFHTFYVDASGALVTVWKTKDGTFHKNTLATGCSVEAPLAVVWNGFVNVYVRTADGKSLIHKARPATATNNKIVWTGQVVA